jgi:hypothetical protein
MRPARAAPYPRLGAWLLLNEHGQNPIRPNPRRAARAGPQGTRRRGHPANASRRAAQRGASRFRHPVRACGTGPATHPLGGTCSQESRPASHRPDSPRSPLAVRQAALPGVSISTQRHRDGIFEPSRQLLVFQVPEMWPALLVQGRTSECRKPQRESAHGQGAPALRCLRTGVQDQVRSLLGVPELPQAIS